MECKIESMDLRICEDIADFKSYEEQLYKLFVELYENKAFLYNGKLVQMKHYPPNYGPKSGFKHLIYENYNHTGDDEDRLPNLRRCERLEWPRTIIENCTEECSKLLIWENKRKGKKNTLIYCDEFDYLVVLGHRNGYYLLTTAYPVEHDNRRNDLLDEYNRYKKQTTHLA